MAGTSCSANGPNKGFNPPLAAYPPPPPTPPPYTCPHDITVIVKKAAQNPAALASKQK